MRFTLLLMAAFGFGLISCGRTEGIKTRTGLTKKQLTTLASYDGQPAISPDGKFLAFVSSQFGDRHILTLDMADGAREALTANEGIDESPCFSPDNQQVVFSSKIGNQKDLWVFDRDSGLKQVTKTASESEDFPVWSSDGTLIYFVVSAPGGSEIRTVQRNNYSNVSLLVSDTVAFGKLAVHPSGDRIFVERGNSRQSDIVTISIGTKQTTRFLNSIFSEKMPSVSPDGKWISFVSDQSGYDEIWISPTDQPKPVQITSDSTKHANPSWSENGRSLFYEETTDWDIKMIQAETQAETLLVKHTGSDESPVMTPDGTTMYFVSDRSGVRSIYKYDVATGAVAMFIGGDHNNDDPEVSPDGKQLVFTSDKTGRRQLWTRSLENNGTAAYMVTVSADSHPSYQARFSPDGDYLAFVSERTGNPDIWIKNMRTGEEQQVTLDPRAELYPSFSTNGLIIFSANWAGRWSIWHTPIVGGLPLPVTRDKTPYGFDSEPSLSKSEKLILFTRSWYDDMDLWLMSLTGGERTTRTLTKDNTNQERHGRWTPDGKHAVYQSGNNTDLWVIDVSPLVK